MNDTPLYLAACGAQYGDTATLELRCREHPTMAYDVPADTDAPHSDACAAFSLEGLARVIWEHMTKSHREARPAAPPGYRHPVTEMTKCPALPQCITVGVRLAPGAGDD